MPCYGTPWRHFTCRSCPCKLFCFRGGSRNLVARNVTIHKFLVKLQKEAFIVRHTTKELLTNQWRAGKWFQGNFNPEHRGTKMSDVSLCSFRRINSGHRLVTAQPSSFIEASCFILALFYVDVISKRVVDFNSSYFISTYPALILLLYFFALVLSRDDFIWNSSQSQFLVDLWKHRHLALLLCHT